jgi:SNF family Na+-dependent transporter
LQIEEDANTIGEHQILTGVWIRTIGQILEAISVSSQIRETDKRQLLKEQKIAIAGDLLVSLGSAFEVIGGLQVIEEEPIKIPRIVP